MKNILFFITHKTLNLENCELTFKSISNQNYKFIFDIMYIYNSHKNELDNNLILEMYNKYNLSNFIKEVKIFDYDETSHKSLGQDIFTIRNYLISNYSGDDRVLILKSDCLLSVNYFNDLSKLPNKPIYFTAPFICAKKRVPNEEIIEYTKRTSFIPSDEITFFVEDYQQSSNNDFNNRPNTKITDNSIKFTSCYVIRDWSCHFITIGLLNNISITMQSWGGVNLSKLVPYFIKTDLSFVVHKYHDIISENRDRDREGPVKDWLNS